MHSKIKRLVGPIGAPTKPEFSEEFALADFLESEIFQTSDLSKPIQFSTLGSLRQVLERIPNGRVSKECIDFIESLLVVDRCSPKLASYL